jgi:hypothetical protein
MHDQTTNTCPGRGCDTQLRNEYLCRRCVTRAERAIADLPALLAELDNTIGRQASGSNNGSTRPGSQLPINLSAMEKRNHAQLVTVTAFEIGYRPRPANLVGTVYAVLADPSLMQYRPDGPDLAKSIHRAVSEWRAAIDHHEDKVFAGNCTECKTPMHTQPNSKTFKCAKCDVEYDTATELRYVLDEIRETLWPLKLIRQYAATSLDVSINDATVRSWRHRGQLVGRGLDIDGQETYRVGDYLDLASAHQARVGIDDRRHAQSQ